MDHRNLTARWVLTLFHSCGGRGALRRWRLLTTVLAGGRARRLDAEAARLSLGRFEDDGRSLIVETTALNWPYYDTIGTPLTPEVKITERFTLSDDQSALTYRQTVTDPATFTEPAVHESQHLALGETIERFVCAPDL
jgi:hypothetical protein